MRFLLAPLKPKGQYHSPDSRMGAIIDPEKASLIEADQQYSYHHSGDPSSKAASREEEKGRVSFPILLLVWLAIVFLVTKSAIFLAFVTDHNPSTQAFHGHDSLCAQPVPHGTPSNWTELYDYEGFAKESAHRLSGAVRIPTQ